jgi:hypothetical protein
MQLHPGKFSSGWSARSPKKMSCVIAIAHLYTSLGVDLSAECLLMPLLPRLQACSCTKRSSPKQQQQLMQQTRQQLALRMPLTQQLRLLLLPMLKKLRLLVLLLLLLLWPPSLTAAASGV